MSVEVYLLSIRKILSGLKLKEIIGAVLYTHVYLYISPCGGPEKRKKFEITLTINVKNFFFLNINC